MFFPYGFYDASTHASFSMCRDILNTCVRNTEEAERVSNPEAASGRGQGKGVWGMIEESELAKTFRQDEKKQPDEPLPTIITGERVTLPTQEAANGNADVVAQAHACKIQLEDLLARSPSSSSAPMSPLIDPGLTHRTRGVLAALGRVIETTSDPAKLEELLTLNDDLTGILTHTAGPPLLGLGIRIESPAKETVIAENGNGMANGNGNGNVVYAEELSDAEEEPMTPRLDKGKGRAEPEPEEPEMVLTPTVMSPAFMIAESDDEDGDHRILLAAEHPEDSVSPTDM